MRATVMVVVASSTLMLGSCGDGSDSSDPGAGSTPTERSPAGSASVSESPTASVTLSDNIVVER